jgi:hypothetical protein
VRRIRLAFIQQGLQPPGWPLEEEGFDSIGHVPFLSQQSAFSAQLSARNAYRNGRKGRKGVWSQIVNSFAYFAPFAVNRHLAEC